MDHCACVYKPKKIAFKYKTSDGKIEPVPTIDGVVWNGWAPAFDVVTHQQIGYITFYYLQQKKYNFNNGNPVLDGYNNYLKVFYVFDTLQYPGSPQTRVFMSEMNFVSTIANQLLPVGMHRATLSSSTMAIGRKSHVVADIRPNADRYWTLCIDW